MVDIGVFALVAFVWGCGIGYCLNGSSVIMSEHDKPAGPDWFDGVNAAFLMQRLVGNAVWNDAMDLVKVHSTRFSRSREQIMLERHEDPLRCNAALTMAALLLAMENQNAQTKSGL